MLIYGRKRALFLFAFVFTAIVLIFILVMFFANRDPVVFLVNQEPVSKKEYTLFFNKNISVILDYFREEHGVKDHPDFWNTRFEGENPLEECRELTLMELTDIKIQQMIAKEYGIVNAIHYSDFLKEYHKENARRERAIAKGEVIYGPQQYDEWSFYQYQFSNMVNKLLALLGEKSFKPGEDEIVDYYERNKNSSQLRNPSSILTRIVNIPYVGTDGKADAKRKEEAREKLEEMRRLVLEGSDFKEIAGSFVDRNDSFAYQERVFDEKSAREDSRLRKALRELAEELDAGQISQVTDMGLGFTLMLCIEKKETGHKPLKEVREFVRSEIIREKYRKMVDERVKNASISIQRKEYEKIRPNGSN